MSIMDLVRKKKAMQFKTQYSGSSTGSGLLGSGVTKYKKPSIGERISSVKQKFQQKKAETTIMATETPRSGVVSVSGSTINDRSRGIVKSFAKGVKTRLAERSKENRAAYLTSNNSNNQPYYLKQTSSNSPYYMNSNGGGGNAAWNWLTKQNKEVKEKSGHIIIKIPKQ